jgi:hypothetical protein
MNEDQKVERKFISSTIIRLLFYAALGALVGSVQALFGYSIIKNTYKLPDNYDLINTIYASIIGNVMLSPFTMLPMYDFIMTVTFMGPDMEIVDAEEINRENNYMCFASPLKFHWIFKKCGIMYITNMLCLYSIIIPIAVLDGLIAFLIGFACLGIMPSNTNFYSDAAVALGSAGGFFSSFLIFAAMFVSRAIYLYTLTLKTIVVSKFKSSDPKPESNTVSDPNSSVSTV